MANKPFRVNRSALPTEDARKMFNPVNCFAKGELTMGADEKPRLAGNCQVVQFGKNRNGNNCMFVCQADFSEVQREHPVLASFVFDHMGRVIDLYYGNSVATPTWRTNVCDGTRASFGFLPPPPPPQQPQIMPMFSYRMNKINDQLKQNAKNMSKDEIDALLRKKNKLKEEYEAEAAEAAKNAKTARDAYDELLKNPRWGCARVLKGPLEFIGCQRNVDRWSSSASLVEGVPYVSCVEVSADFDNQFDTSPENLPKIKPYFEHIPLTETSRYGAIGREYYDSMGFENRFGNTGFQSFLVMDSNGTSMIETRQGSCSRPEPIPPRLSVSKPETRQKFEVELRKGRGSVQKEMAALKWLEIEMHQLVFPEGPIDETFADVSFRWVHDFSMKFKAPAVSLSSDALAKMMERTLQQQRVLPGSTQTFAPAMVAPAMRQSIFSAIATGSPLYKQPVTSCKCTPTNHNPTCKNRFCKYRYASVQCFSFEWPIRRIVSEPPEFVRLLAEQIFESQDGERRKKLAAEVAETKRKAAADAKKAAADAKREEKKEEATLRKAEAAAAKASGVLPASLRSRRAPSASAAPVASSAVASSAVASSASAEPASRKRKTASAASQSESSKKTKGGFKSRSKSKSKRRVHK